MDPRQGHSIADSTEGKIARGWRLTQVAWRLIRKDRTTMLLAFAGILTASIFTFLIFYSAVTRIPARAGLQLDRQRRRLHRARR
jgi:hypothetical protein